MLPAATSAHHIGHPQAKVFENRSVTGSRQMSLSQKGQATHSPPRNPTWFPLPFKIELIVLRTQTRIRAVISPAFGFFRTSIGLWAASHLAPIWWWQTSAEDSCIFKRTWTSTHNYSVQFSEEKQDLLVILTKFLGFLYTSWSSNISKSTPRGVTSIPLQLGTSLTSCL